MDFDDDKDVDLFIVEFAELVEEGKMIVLCYKCGWLLDKNDFLCSICTKCGAIDREELLAANTDILPKG